jgi:uncharacterized membrane protein
MSNLQESFEEKFSTINNTVDTTSEYNPQDIKENKFMAILAYFGILVIIPILAAKDSKFARFHSNQGLILCITAILYSLAYQIFVGVIISISYHLSWMVGIVELLGVVLLIWFIIGIVNASKGRAKELPFIGHFKLLRV